MKNFEDLTGRQYVFSVRTMDLSSPTRVHHLVMPKQPVSWEQAREEIIDTWFMDGQPLAIFRVFERPDMCFTLKRIHTPFVAREFCLNLRLLQNLEILRKTQQQCIVEIHETRRRLMLLPTTDVLNQVEDCDGLDAIDEDVFMKSSEPKPKKPKKKSTADSSAPENS